MLTALPLIRTDEKPEMTAMERSAAACEQIVTSLMAAATLSEDLSEAERETYIMLTAATVYPAEA